MADFGVRLLIALLPMFENLDFCQIDSREFPKIALKELISVKLKLMSTACI